jgi:hypothetical protein
LQDALGALNGATLVQHGLPRAVGVKDAAGFVNQHDGTAERIEGFGHPCTLDGADIEHVADRHRPPQMRQQQLAKLDSRSVMRPCRSFRVTQARQMHLRVHCAIDHGADDIRLPDFRATWP